MLFAPGGCDRHPATASTGHPRTARPIVVSLVPAATDLILGMGASEHLAGVSNWDAARPQIAALPRVGDYRTVDWEKIAQIHPDVMIVQFAPDKMPPGLAQRAAQLGAKLVNVKINRLDDVFETVGVLGGALDESSKAQAAAGQLRAQLDAVRACVAGKPPVRTMISRSESALAVVGGGNFMDDLLTLAGGTNVIDTGENSYPTIDRERLSALNPDVVLHLLPGASPQEIEQAKSFWPTVPHVSAVKDNRVYLLTDSYLLLPGYSVGKIAELFASKLHPQTTDPTKERL
jgi:ABC-type Fe3+-hydroxamate transport system substrate-binding protein